MMTLDTIRFSEPPVFGSRDAAERYHEELDAAVRHQTVRFAVAPGQCVELPGGRRLLGGDEITIQALSGCQSPGGVLSTLLRRGVVLERSQTHVAAARRSRGCRYIVAPRRSLLIPVGRIREIRAEGLGVHPHELGPDGELRILELVDKGVLIDTGTPEPPPEAA